MSSVGNWNQVQYQGSWTIQRSGQIIHVYVVKNLNTFTIFSSPSNLVYLFISQPFSNLNDGFMRVLLPAQGKLKYLKVIYFHMLVFGTCLNHCC